MKMSPDTIPLIKNLIWGAVIGAAATLLIGFVWGGWVTGGTAKTAAQVASRDAVIAALAPICVLQFNGKPEAATQLIALRALHSYEQGDFVNKTGAAIMPGSQAAVDGVAKACADLLSKASS